MVYAWFVDFRGWFSFYYKSDSDYVRAVRGDRVVSMDHFVINGDGTVTDTNTGIMWMQASAYAPGNKGYYTWQEALFYAQALFFADYYDWRLPTFKELQSIEDYSIHNMDATYFPDTKSDYYWTSTTVAGTTFTSWCINFNGSGCGGQNKIYPYVYARTMRGGSYGT